MRKMKIKRIPPKFIPLVSKRQNGENWLETASLMKHKRARATKPVFLEKTWVIFLTLSLSGCGIFGTSERQALPVPPYAPVAGALDESYLHSPSGDIAAHYPSGWLQVDISTIPLANVEEVYTDHERRRALVLAE